MRKQKPASDMVVGGTLTLTPLAWTDARGITKKSAIVKQKVEAAGIAQVSIDQAAKAATAHISGTVIRANLTKEQNRIIWELEVVTNEGQLQSVRVDGRSGMVLS